MPYVCDCTTAYTIIGSVLVLTVGGFFGYIVLDIIRDIRAENKRNAVSQGEDLTQYMFNFAAKAKLISKVDVSQYRLSDYVRKYNFRNKRMKYDED